MKTILTTTITMFLLLFVNNAMADRGSDRNRHDGYKSKGQRIEQRLDARGDRIERRFDHRANVAAEQGKYGKARHFQKKGDRIDHRLDRKGAQIHARLDHRGAYHQHRHYRPYPAVAYRAGHRYPNNFASVVIQQPGLWLGWGIHR